MEQRTRDNLIYLAVGLGIAALVVADFIYAEKRGQEMWMPTKFASRLVSSIALLGYFMARETRKAGATLAQILACVLLGSTVQLVLGLGFRQTIVQLSGLSFSALAALESFLVLRLLVRAVRYLRPE